MTGLLYLSWRHLTHHRRATLLLVLCLATTAFLPMATRVVTADFERDLVARADATPLVAGVRGNRFDLVLAALYFRGSPVDPMEFGALDGLAQSSRDLVVPLGIRHTARTHPVVSTSPDYFDVRALETASGELFAWLGEAVVGSAVLPDELTVGSSLYTDAKGTYDITRPAPLELVVVGRLAPTGGPDDHAVFVSVETGWMLEGALHGHDDAEELDTSRLMGASDEHITVGPALVENRAANEENRDEFHMHADPATLPLTAALVFPADAKSRTMLKTRVNAAGRLAVLDPMDVVEELLAFVFRIRALLDLFAALLGGTTLLMGALVILLSVRLRAGELLTLERIGASRGVAARLVGTEVGIVLALALGLAGAGLLALRVFIPDPMALV